jgi:hypothetical protein
MKTKLEITQIEKFKRAARELETDDSEEHFNEKLGKIARAKPEARAIVHASDCAVNNAPAMPPGPCNCGAEKAGK